MGIPVVDYPKAGDTPSTSLMKINRLLFNGAGTGGGGGGGNDLYGGLWTWTNKTADAANGGQIGIDAATWAAATHVNINVMTSDNRDMTVAFTDLFTQGNELYIQQKNDATRAAKYTIAGAGVVGGTGGWYQFPVTHISDTGTQPGGSANMVVNLIVKGGGGTSNAVQKTGDTMTGTLRVSSSDGSANLSLISGTKTATVSQDTSGILWLTPGGTDVGMPVSDNLLWFSGTDWIRLGKTSDNHLVLSSSNGAGINIHNNTGGMDVVLSVSSSTGDLTVTCNAGPNAGKSVNLTSGKWV